MILIQNLKLCINYISCMKLKHRLYFLDELYSILGFHELFHGWELHPMCVGFNFQMICSFYICTFFCYNDIYRIKRRERN
jgi:hypothetical protein